MRIEREIRIQFAREMNDHNCHHPADGSHGWFLVRRMGCKCVKS